MCTSSAKRGLFTNDGVDASKLLEDLDTASNQETSPRLDRVASNNVLPSCLAGVLICDRLSDDGVQALYLRVAQVAGSLDACQHGKALLRTVVCSEPTWRLWNYEEQTQDGEENDALQNCRDSPCIACSVADEGVVDPVDDEDTEVERRKLRADVHTTACLGTELSLQDRHGGVDETKANSGYNTADDEVCATESSCLKDGTDHTDDSSDTNALATTQRLSYECSGHCTNEAANWKSNQQCFH